MVPNANDYDVAVSFAGAQRNLVEPVVRACQALGLTVFYDKDHTVDLWGRSVITATRKIYGGARARYFMPFLSEEYLASAYPMDEFSAAMRRSIEVGADAYILPILVGPVLVPAELLSPAILYLRWEDYGAERLAQAVARRVGIAREHRSEPQATADLAPEAPGVRLPRLPPADSTNSETLESVLTNVGARFERASGRLATFGFNCLVKVTDAAVDVRVKQQGRSVCGLRLYSSNTAPDDRLLMTFEWPRVSGDHFNGWVAVRWDTGLGRIGLQFTDFGNAGSGRPMTMAVTTDELFHLLWEKIVDFVESVH